MKKVLTLLLAFALTFTLASCGPNEEDVANLADAKQKLSLDVADPASVTSNIELPSTGLHSSTITWESNNTDVIANDGTVTRPAVGEDDVTVVLTATITVGEESDTKEFQFKVIAAVPSVAVTIAELEGDTLASGDVVEITGVVTGIINGNGFHVEDATGGAYVYSPDGFDCVIGDEVTVMGEKGAYNFSTQVTEVQSIEINSSDNTLPTHTATTLADIYAQNEETTTWFNDMFEFDAYVAVMGQYSNAYFLWYDAELNLYKTEVYYKSGTYAEGEDESATVTALKALEGKKVTAQVILKDFSWGAYRVTVDTPSTFTEGTITDQEKANLAVALQDEYFNSLGAEVVSDLDLADASEVIMDGENGAALAWTSSNIDVIENDGTVALPVGATADVDVTVVATVGTATATKTYSLTVADATTLDAMTVTEALAVETGNSVIVEGVVTAMRYGRPFIQDPDGTSMFVYSKLDVEVGDKVVLQGERSEYTSWGNDMQQLTGAVLVSVVSQGNATVFDTTTTPAELAANISTNHANAFTMTLKYLTTEDDTGGSEYFFFEGYVDANDAANNVRIKMDPDWFPTLVTYLDANNEIEVSFVQYDVSYDEARIVPVGFPGLTSAQKLEIVDAIIDVAGETSGDLDLVTALPMYDAVITWDASGNAAVTDEGVVTRPENGNGNTVGDVVASVVIGTDAAVDKTYSVTVLEAPAEPDSAADVLAMNSGDDVYVEGVVKYLVPGGDNFFIEDADGTALYINDYNATFDFTSITVAEGDVVRVTGIKGYYRLYKVDEVSNIEIVSSGSAISAATSLTDLAAFRAAATLEDIGKTYTFTDVEVFSISGDYIYFYSSDMTTGGNQKIAIYFDYSVTLPTIEVGDTLTFTGVFAAVNTSTSFSDSSIFRFSIDDVNDIVVTPGS